MLKKNVKNRLRESGIPILSLISGFLIWEALMSVFNIPEFLLPRPSKVVWEIITNFKFLLGHAGITMLEAVTGFIIGNSLGFIMAVIFTHSKTAEKGLYPYAVALSTIPIIAMVPFLILLFGIGITSKIAIVTIICLFPTLVNTVKGLKAVDDESLNLFKSLSANRWQIFIKLRLPVSLTYIFPALKTSATISVLGALVGEFVGANAGIGHLIFVSMQSLNALTMLAAITMSALLGLSFFWLISLVEKKVVFWQKSEKI